MTAIDTATHRPAPTATSLTIDEIKAIDKRHVVHPWAAQSEYEPVVTTRAEGNYVWDDAGNRLLDFTAQAFYASIGHGNRRVIEAIVRQARTLATVYGGATEPKSALTR